MNRTFIERLYNTTGNPVVACCIPVFSVFYLCRQLPHELFLVGEGAFACDHFEIFMKAREIIKAALVT